MHVNQLLELKGIYNQVDSGVGMDLLISSLFEPPTCNSDQFHHLVHFSNISAVSNLKKQRKRETVCACTYVQVQVQSELCQLSAPQWFDFIQELQQQVASVSVLKEFVLYSTLWLIGM